MAQPTSRLSLRPALGLVALLIAAGLLYLSADTAFTVARESRWPVVPATLDAVDLHRPGSATSRSLSVGARYHYEVAGSTHTGTRVSVYAPDSLGRFFQRTYDDLHARLERHETVPAHVNPDAPDDAVLLPVWRPEVFAFRLGCAVVALVAAAVAFRRGPWTPRPAAPVSDAEPDPAPDPEGERAMREERATPRVARGRRLALGGIVLLACAYVLLERPSGDSYALIDRILASHVVATGTVFVSPADARVRALFEEVRNGQAAEATLVDDTSRPPGASYTLRVTASTRDAALASLDQVRAALERAYHAQAQGDLTTFADAYVTPMVDGSAALAKTTTLALLIGFGVLCLCAAAVMLVA